MSKVNTILLKAKKNKYRIAAAFFVMMLLLSLTGVSAWLVSAAGSITNNFTPASVRIELGETDTEIDEDDSDKTNSYEITPSEEGWEDIEKDPSITVPAGTLDCWVFVTVEEQNDFSHFMTYEIDDGWQQLDGVSGVYWRRSQSSAESQDFNILKDRTVKVKDSVTKAEINALTEDEYPKLNITGFAIQLVGFDTAADAWTYLNPDAEQAQP